ncbi:inositol-pentakisphosphate 2-kinase isoform X2 [Periophthalmus magnuspinnatus]|nr:inositol-pentakisphosphate 2-kinase isoform X2 [Periophthalmus magnuspinnatus]
MDPDKLDENDWRYHGEGNKSLVVSHIQIPRVLRLLKYPAADSENPPQTAEQAYRQIQNIVDFTSNVMSCFIGEQFIHSGEVVKLPLEFVRQLSIKVQHQRPVWRCNKVMDIYSGCALCLPNLTTPLYHQPTLTPPICIEIKPKCGFLPSSKHVSKEIKTRVCRFCMHQHYKVSNGIWKKRSLYCPLDLFSGSRQRMTFAIRHLIEEPQNNFKIFKGGQLIYSSRDRDREDLDDSSDCLSSLMNQLRPYFTFGPQRINGHLGNKSLLNEFIQVLVKALLSGGGASTVDPSHRHSEGRSFCEASAFNRERVRHHSQGLPSDCVLSRVLHTQRLDSLDIEGLFPLYKRVEQHLHHFPKERSRLQVEGPYDEMFLEKLQKCPSEDDGSVEYATTKVHQYRAAMTAKDCSIMITLMPTAEENDDQQRTFSFSVAVLDLDPKPFESVPRQLRLDQKVVNGYLRSSSGICPKTPQQREDCTLLFHPV